MITHWHRSAAAPLGVGAAWGMALLGADGMTSLGVGALVIWSATWNALDDPMRKRRLNPAAALARKTSRLGWSIRGENEADPPESFQGPTLCFEWCLLVALLVGALAYIVPPLSPWWQYWAGAALLGTGSHVLVGLMAPSGVTLSAAFNRLRYREIWHRHTLGWFATDTGAEAFQVVPSLYLLSALILLGMIGWLHPIIGWLFGGLL